MNFDVRIDALRDGYRAWVSGAPVGGEAAVQFTLPQDVIQSRSPADHAAAKIFGEKIFEMIFDGEVLSYLRRSQEVAQKQGDGLRMRIALSGAPELARLPWEMIYDPTFDHFFSLSTSTPVVRYLDLPREAQPLTVTLPLKLLVMISSPKGHTELDSEAEWDRLSQSLGDLVDRGWVILERMQGATLGNLQRLLRGDEYHVFHYIGHGAFDEKAQDGVLLLEDEHGNGHPVSGGFLGTMLHDHRTLQLVVLNACQGGTAGRQDPFAGTAQTLVQRGIPAVVAMQQAITDRAAVQFSQEFYSALADSYPVDAALVEGRKAIYAAGNPVEWATPVLYMRSPDGLLFELKPGTQPVKHLQQQKIPIEANHKPVLPEKIEIVQEIKVLEEYGSEMEDLRAQLQRRQLVLFIGADLPVETTGLPDRQTLANELALRQGLPSGERLSAVAQQVMSHGNRWAFTDYLQTALDTVGLAPKAFHQAVMELVRAYELESLVSLAYDDLLELAFRQAGEGLNVIVGDEQLSFASPDRPTLIRLNGDIRQVTSLIVTEQDQNALLRGRVKPEIVDEVRRAFRRNSILFLGYDLSDPSVSAWFDEVAGDRFQRNSYAVWLGLTPAQAKAYETNRGLRIIEVDPLTLLKALL